MGKATTLALANAGYGVIFTGRNVEAGEEIAKEAREKNLDVTFKKLDYADLASIQDFASEFAREHPRLDLLVNNAALTKSVHELTRDGNEFMFQTNALGPFYLTKLLLPLLKASPDARVVYVCSDAHWTEHLDLEDLNSLKIREKAQTEQEKASGSSITSPSYWATYTMYCNSKMLNILLGKKLSRSLEAENCRTLQVYLLHPGAVGTSLARGTPLPGVNFMMKHLFLSPETGARTQIYLSLAPKEKLKSGAYYVSCQPGNCLARCDDEKLQDQAWEKMEELLVKQTKK